MSTPTLESIQAYYDERIDGKIQDFTHANPRIEAAIQLVAEWAPPHPTRILEIGCGIGATSWRMARAWPQAEVIGADVSPASIEVAKTCFQRPNLSYRAALIKEGVLAGKFDLVVLMDIYEHIALEDRVPLHAAIRSLSSLGAAVIDDVLGLLVLAVVAAIATAADKGKALSGVEIGLTVTKAVVFVIGAIALGRLLSPHRLFLRLGNLPLRCQQFLD